MTDDPRNHAPLAPADADALDALVDAGFDPAGVPPFLRERAVRVATLLGLLEQQDGERGGAAAARRGRSLLVDVTMARVLRARSGGGPNYSSGAPEPVAAPETWLSDADSLALDALVGASWSAEALADTDHATRAGRIAAILSNLSPTASTAGAIADSREDLIAATVARVQLAASAARRPGATAAAYAADLVPVLGRPGGFRMADLISVAAAILVAVSIIWPTLTFNRSLASRAVCETSMHNAGLGFSLYAGDHHGELPRVGNDFASVGPGGKWWDVGNPNTSHSANLFVLVTQGYTTLADLACAGNSRAPINLSSGASGQHDWGSPEEVSFSYQLFSPDQKPRWRGPVRFVVITDKSPVVERARNGEGFDPLARSHNHAGMGQNVLFNDASVEWLTRPELPGGDNIWLPRSAEGQPGARLHGAETPEDARDAFVGP